MAAMCGFTTSHGYIFNMFISDTEFDQLNGPDKTFYSLQIFERKYKELGWEPSAYDCLQEVVVRGYGGLAINIVYKDEDGSVSMVDYTSPSSNQSVVSATTSSQSSQDATEEVASQEDGGKNWTPAKVKSLIALYATHKDSFFNSTKKKKDTWQKIADSLNATGDLTCFSAAEVDKKWRGLKERYSQGYERSVQEERLTAPVNHEGQEDPLQCQHHS